MGRDFLVQQSIQGRQEYAVEGGTFEMVEIASSRGTR